MDMAGNKKIILKVCFAIVLLMTLLSFTISYGRYPIAPPTPELPDNYEDQLQEAETVEDIEEFLADIEVLPSQLRQSAKLLAFQKLRELPDKDAAVELLSRIYHDGTYVYSDSLSRHVEDELIRTFGEIGTPEARAEVIRILDQAIELEKDSRSRHATQLGIINAAMETMAESWYQNPEVRDHLEEIARQFDEHAESVRTFAGKYYLISEMRAEGIEGAREMVKWLLDVLEYDNYEKKEIEIRGDIYIIYEGDKQTWAGLKNEAILEVLKAFSVEAYDCLREEQLATLDREKADAIEYLARQTLVVRSTWAINYLRDIIRGLDHLSNMPEWWAGRLNIPKDKMLEKEYVAKAVDMLSENALRFLIADGEDLRVFDDERLQLRDYILERCRERLQEIEKAEETVPSPPESTVSGKEDADVLSEKQNEHDRSVRYLMPITIVVLAGILLIFVLTYYSYRRRNSKQ